MLFLIDEQLPDALCGWLREHGHHAVHVSELGLEAGDDVDIWTAAIALEAHLMTKDSDFISIRRQAAAWACRYLVADWECDEPEPVSLAGHALAAAHRGHRVG